MEKMSLVHNFGLWRDLSHAGASAPLGSGNPA